MTRKNRPEIGVGVAAKAVGLEAMALALILFFTKSLVYCIISLSGAAIGVAGIALLIRLTDRILKKGKGRTMFFLLAQLKLLIVAAAFFAISRWSRNGAVFFIQGIATAYLAVVIEGKTSHGT